MKILVWKIQDYRLLAGLWIQTHLEDGHLFSGSRIPRCLECFRFSSFTFAGPPLQIFYFFKNVNVFEDEPICSIGILFLSQRGRQGPGNYFHLLFSTKRSIHNVMAYRPRMQLNSIHTISSRYRVGHETFNITCVLKWEGSFRGRSVLALIPQCACRHKCKWYKTINIYVCIYFWVTFVAQVKQMSDYFKEICKNKFPIRVQLFSWDI